MRTPPRSRIVAFALKKLAGRRSASLSDVLNSTWLLGLGLVAGVILHPYVEERIFITIFPALAVISVWCGIGPGVLAALFGGIAAVLLWMPLDDVQSAWPKVLLNLAIFWLMAGIILAFGHLVRLLLDELRSLEREASLRADELRHRVQNLSD